MRWDFREHETEYQRLLAKKREKGPGVQLGQRIAGADVEDREFALAIAITFWTGMPRKPPAGCPWRFTSTRLRPLPSSRSSGPCLLRPATPLRVVKLPDNSRVGKCCNPIPEDA